MKPQTKLTLPYPPKKNPPSYWSERKYSQTPLQYIVLIKGIFEVTNKVNVKDQMHISLTELLPLLGDTEKIFVIYSK